MILHIDIETFSGADLTKSGIYKYVESPDFEILMAAIKIIDFENAGDVYVIDFTDPVEWDKNYTDLLEVLQNPKIIKKAWNATFERLCLGRFFGVDLPADQWECTMAAAAQISLPLSLDAASKALGTAPKDSAGKALIRYFCMPCKPTKANGERTRNLPEHAPEKWEAFKNYCAQDVEAEHAISKKISFFTPHALERKIYLLDQKINDRGIGADPEFIYKAMRFDQEIKAKLLSEAVEITGLDNPNSVTQLSAWLNEAGEEVTTLRKADVFDLLEGMADGKTRRVLEIRQELSKTSVKKYAAMAASICTDNRIRGLVQYYGANRTGRWAGRLVQVQNLPQNHLRELDLARRIVSENTPEDLELFFGNVPDTLSQLIRTAFVAGPGKTFVVADFSAIEARVIAWLAGEKWRLDVFNTHGKIYEASAAAMFKVDIKTVTKGSPLRQKGKIAELALGYQGGAGALITMGALKMGLTEDELPGLVTAWRKANPAIVKYWHDVEAAAKEAIETGAAIKLRNLSFYCARGCLFIVLPSGRELVYLGAKLRPNRRGEEIVYKGMDQTTKQWKEVNTYGGKLVENIVQAAARDCLAWAMLNIDQAGYNIVMHVHDEIVIEAPEDVDSLAVDKIMSEGAPWAAGLPLTADSYKTKYYKKD